MKAVLLALLLPSSAFAQSLGGIALHDPQAAIQQRYPSQRTVEIQDSPGVSLMPIGGGNHVLFCRGKVSEVQEVVGHSVHDYAAMVEAARNQYGEPTENRTLNTRSRSGEISSVEARWVIEPTQAYRVAMTQIGDTNAEVIRSFYDPTSCS